LLGSHTEQQILHTKNEITYVLQTKR
jgi:hypothetical protein